MSREGVGGADIRVGREEKVDSWGEGHGSLAVCAVGHFDFYWGEKRGVEEHITVCIDSS